MTKRICSRRLEIVCSHQFRTSAPAAFRPATSRQTYVLRAAESDTGDARHASEVQLLERLAGLLLVARVDDGGRAGGQVSLALLNVGLVAAVESALFIECASPSHLFLPIPAPVHVRDHTAVNDAHSLAPFIDSSVESQKRSRDYGYINVRFMTCRHYRDMTST